MRRLSLVLAALMASPPGDVAAGPRVRGRRRGSFGGKRPGSRLGLVLVAGPRPICPARDAGLRTTRRDVLVVSNSAVHLDKGFVSPLACAHVGARQGAQGRA